MRTRILATGAALLLAGSQLSRAGDVNVNGDTRLFRDNDFSLDLFGTDTLGRHTINNPTSDNIRNNSVLGVGVGLNAFVCRFAGFGADVYTENTAHDFVDNASGNFIVRIPIDSIHLAPYAYAGGGYKFDPVHTGFGQIGGGLEFRLTPNFSLFADARYVLADRIADYGVGRAGIRVSF